MTMANRTQIHSQFDKAAHQLAAELAQWGCDSNLLWSAAAYLQAHPKAELDDWLERLARLGPLFGSSQQTGRYRHLLNVACNRVSPRPRNGREWIWVLSCAARLYAFYDGDRHQARLISDVRRVSIPDPPQEYRPPVQEAPQPEDDLPEVREQPSEEAESLFGQLQSLWAQKKDSRE
jgi:hypothetical protein